MTNLSMDEATYERRLAIVDSLSQMPDDDPEGEPQTLEDRVCDVMLEHRATLADFRFLDEKPGAAPGGGYRFSTKEERGCDEPSQEWHWKLRRVRNRAGKRLFATLAT